jgi:hypothetical protein
MKVMFSLLVALVFTLSFGLAFADEMSSWATFGKVQGDEFYGVGLAIPIHGTEVGMSGVKSEAPGGIREEAFYGTGLAAPTNREEISSVKGAAAGGVREKDESSRILEQLMGPLENKD